MKDIDLTGKSWRLSRNHVLGIRRRGHRLWHRWWRWIRLLITIAIYWIRWSTWLHSPALRILGILRVCIICHWKGKEHYNNNSDSLWRLDIICHKKESQLQKIFLSWNVCNKVKFGILENRILSKLTFESSVFETVLEFIPKMWLCI